MLDREGRVSAAYCTALTMCFACRHSAIFDLDPNVPPLWPPARQSAICQRTQQLDDFRIATTRRIGDVKSSSYYDEMNNFHCYFQQSTLRKIPFGETCRPGCVHFKFKFRQFVRIGFVNGQFEAVERNERISRLEAIKSVK